jgi:hypothetical protein
MTQNQAFNPLSEAESFIYMQAMDIPVWVERKAEPLLPLALTDDKQPVKPEQQQAKPESAINLKTKSEQISQAVLDSEKALALSSNSETGSELKPESRSEMAATQNVSPETKVKTDAASVATETAAKREQQAVTSYLKMVNWKTNPTADRSLLIICRHQIDQPAHSFAQPSAPSKFMQDYMQAIEGLLAKNKLSVQIQLAHLTEAGLGNGNVPMGETVNKLNPDLILLLGEESIKHLFDQKLALAECRGKLHQVKTIEVAKALASYHPFSLISEPPLKRLAFEDLSLACQILREMD